MEEELEDLPDTEKEARIRRDLCRYYVSMCVPCGLSVYRALMEGGPPSTCKDPARSEWKGIHRIRGGH